MNNSLVIREATIADIAAIRHIAYHTWPKAYGDILSKEQLDYMLEWMYSENALAEQFQKGHCFFMADLANSSMGFASVSAEGNHIYKLNKLYVLPDTQKTGAGKALLHKVIQYTKEHGGNRLQLQVNRNNNAKNFYEKHGFTIILEADLEIGNGFLMNDYIMERVVE